MYALPSMPIRGYHRQFFMLSNFPICNHMVPRGLFDTTRRQNCQTRLFRYPHNRSFWAQQKHIIIYLNLSKCSTMHFTRCKFIPSFFSLLLRISMPYVWTHFQRLGQKIFYVQNQILVRRVFSSKYRRVIQYRVNK